MSLKLHRLVLIALLCFGWPISSWAAETHRLLILDIGREQANGRAGSRDHRILVVEIESGKVLGQALIGFNSSIALSPKGDVVSAISYYGGGGAGHSRLEFFRATDMKPLENGPFPSGIPRMTYQMGAALDSRLSPDGKELLVQGPGPTPAQPAQLADTSLNVVRRELNEEGLFKRTGKTVIIPRAYGVDFLRVADWPRIHIWKHYLGLLEVVDVSRGNILSRLPLADDPILKDIDPAALDKADLNMVWRLSGHGSVVADGERYAFYVPRHPNSPRRPVGFIKKIDLSLNPPKVIVQGKNPEPELCPPALVSEAAGALFVVRAKVGPLGLNGSMVEPTSRIKIFSTKDLQFQRLIECSMDFDRLEASKDGKYLYALNEEQAKLAVIDIATGKEVKVLENLGKYPYLMIAIP